jgi:PmbA protein
MRNTMIDRARDQLQSALETARHQGASAAKLSFRQAERIDCSFEGGRLKNTGSSHAISLGVEVLLDGRRAGVSGNRLRDVNDLVHRAVALAAVGSQAHFDQYPPAEPLGAVRTHSPRTVELSREQLIESGQAIVERLKAYHPDLFIEAGAGRRESESLLLTSGGVCHQAFHSNWSLGAYAQRTEDTDMLFAGYSRRGVDLTDQFSSELVSGRILEDLRHGESIAEAPHGKVTALLEPDIFRAMLTPLFLGVSGRNVAKGDSPLRGRLGQRVLDRCLSVIDEPLTDYAPGAAACDSSGVPTRATPIIRDGQLLTFLYDLDSAGLAAARPTGHDGCMPCSPTVLPGSRTGQQMLADIEDGLLIKMLIGFGQGNLINGDFSCNVGLGFRIRKGQIAGRVKNVMVAGNFYELFERDLEVSSDVDPLLRVPHAMVQGLSASAKS